MERAIKRINIPMASNLHRQMKMAAARLGIQIKEFVVEAISKAVRETRHEKEQEDSMTPEDIAWLETGNADALKALFEIEKEIPPAELREYLASFENTGIRIKWNKKTGQFDEIRR